MKLNKVIAVPALALAAGLSLAACGSQAAHSSAPAATHSAPAKPVATHSAVAKPAVPVIGQPVQVGSFTVTVTQFKCVTKIVSPPSSDGTSEPDSTNTPTRGQFCVATYKMVNTTHQPQSASIDGVLSASGNTYRTTEDFTAGTNAAHQFYGLNWDSPSSVNPGEPASDVFVWDVPTGIHPQSVTLTPYDGTDSSATVNVNS